MTPDQHWDLWRRDPRATPFQSPAWLDPWWARFGSDGARLDAVAWAGDRPVAALPMQVWNDAGVRWRIPLAAGQSDYSDALLDPTAPAARDALWAALTADADRWDELLLPDLRADSPLLGPVPAGWVAEDAPHETCPVLALPPAPPLLPTMSKSRRRKVVHDHHRADRLGGVETVYAASAEIDEAMDALVALHADRWAREGQAGVLADPSVQAFLRDAAHALDAAGLLRLVLVRHAGRIVSVLLGFADARAGYSYINGNDMSIPGQSFGTLAFARLIEGVLADGAATFQFLRGEEAYKYAWGAEPTVTTRRIVRRA